jgi:pimeloyl-ACP methyl ester carboxylesterase
MTKLEDFHYQQFGISTGPQMVFLHGLMGSANNWRKIVSSFESQFQCLVYDQRGHGRSFHPKSGYAPEDYAKDLLFLVEALRLPPFVLIGHSMGGRNALCFASQYPQHVKALVIEDIGPEAAPEANVYYEYLLGMVPTPFVSREAAKNYLYQDFVKNVQSRENPQTLAAFFYSNMEEKPSGQVDWRFSRQGIIDSVVQGRNQDRWQDVMSLKCPTLLIRGADSKEFKHETYLEILQRQPIMRGVEIEGAGHWVHSEKPQEFIQSIQQFLLDQK